RDCRTFDRAHAGARRRHTYRHAGGNRRGPDAARIHQGWRHRRMHDRKNRHIAQYLSCIFHNHTLTGLQMKRLIIALGLALASFGATAESFPSKPLTLIVPYSAGGSSDALARALGQAISKEAGESVVIENRPGGSTVIGAQALLSKPSDGHSALLIAASFVINPY